MKIAVLAAGVLITMIATPAAFADEAPSVVVLTAPGTPTSDRGIEIELASGTDLALVSGETASVTWTDPGTGVSVTSYVAVGTDGIARFSLRSWRSTTITATVGASTATLTLGVAPTMTPLLPPASAPARRAEYLADTDPAGLGVGANPQVMTLSADRQASMRGLSWHPGCLSMGELREVRVNYWGADGYRHRGVLIARARAADAVARSFVDLYAIGYRMHSVHPVDVYGANPLGIGANDYASMAAGNTSMFNCRYQVGKESSRTWSPHATGLALDINPWENPYLSRSGLLPNSWWYMNRGGSPMSIRRDSAVTRILVNRGWIWGARFDDLQHFDYAG